MNPHINEFNALNHISSNLDWEFMETLLEPEDATYPWNVADESSVAYFQHLELQFDLLDFPEAELITSANNFYQNLDMIWDQVTVIQENNSSKNTINYLQVILQNAFSTIPGVILTLLPKKLPKFSFLKNQLVKNW